TFVQYLVSDKKKDHQESDVLIVLTPHIVRLPDWTKANLRSISAGSEVQVQVRRESDVRTPSQQAPAQQPAAVPNGGAGLAPAAAGGGKPATAGTPGWAPPRRRVQPGGLNL